MVCVLGSGGGGGSVIMMVFWGLFFQKECFHYDPVLRNVGGGYPTLEKCVCVYVYYVTVYRDIYT